MYHTSSTVGGGASMSSSSYAYSSSSGGGGGGIQAGGLSSGIHASSGAFAISRKVNVQRSAAASGNSMIMALGSLSTGNASYAGSQAIASNPKMVVQRHVREQAMLGDLNEKLAKYIEETAIYRIKYEEEKTRNIKLKAAFEAIETRLGHRYDAEILRLQALVDATAKDKAELTLKIQHLESFYNEYKLKYDNELAAHETTKLKLPRLEKECTEKEAQIKLLAHTLSSLEPKVAELKGEISKYQRETVEAKMGLDEEIVRRCELESKLVTKTEEIAFVKKTYDEKLSWALDIDFESEGEFSSDLASALKDIRAEYQAQLEAMRGSSSDEWIMRQINTMMVSSKKQQDEVALLRQELTMSKESCMKLNSTISQHLGTIASLQEQMNAMKIEHGRVIDQLQSTINAKMEEIKNKDAQMAALVLELNGLMKMDLTPEIGTYHRLLQAGGTSGVLGGSTGGGSTGGGLHGGGVLSGGGVVGGGGSSSSGATISSSASTTMTTTSTGFGGAIPAAERGYYLNIFTNFDRSGDGRINGRELKAMFDHADNLAFGGRAKRNATQKYCDSLMMTADSDGSGLLSFDEFLRLMIFEKKIFLKNAFKAADVGGKGFLTEVEVLNGLAAAGYEIDDGVRNFVRGAVGGADGKINFNEFVMNL